MARRNARREVREEGGWSWWWLALPGLGLAAYVAFDATLGLVAPHEDVQDAAPVTRSATERPGLAPLADAPPVAEAPADAPVAAAAPAVAPVADEPAPTPTASDARSAGASGVKTKAKPKKPAPKEDLTEQDRKALDRVIERATEQQAR